MCDAVWQDVDCLLTPTAGTIYRVADMQADPIRLNSNLGYYTNFMNLLDYAAVAVPAGFQASGDAQGLPWGVTLAAPAFKDVPLLRLADRHRAQAAQSLGATTTTLADTPAINSTDLPKGSNTAGTVKVAVCGAHLSGLPLNWQLTQRGAPCSARAQSAPEYNFYALAGGPVQRPGMVRVNERRRRHRHGSVGTARRTLRQLRRRHPRPAGHRQSQAGRRVVGERVCVRGDWG
ncbi:MAG: amidase family protein [Burkholderiaceae bacterium]